MSFRKQKPRPCQNALSWCRRHNSKDGVTFYWCENVFSYILLFSTALPKWDFGINETTWNRRRMVCILTLSKYKICANLFIWRLSTCDILIFCKRQMYLHFAPFYRIDKMLDLRKDIFASVKAQRHVNASNFFAKILFWQRNFLHVAKYTETLYFIL